MLLVVQPSGHVHDVFFFIFTTSQSENTLYKKNQERKLCVLFKC